MVPFPLGNPLGKCFTKRFLLVRRELEKCISQAHLSQKYFLRDFEDFHAKSTIFFLKWPGLLLLRHPPSPHRFLHGAAASAQSRRVFARGPRCALTVTGASSSILSCWQRRAPKDLMHLNGSPEVIRGSMTSLTVRTLPPRAQKWGLGFDFPKGKLAHRRGATSGATF